MGETMRGWWRDDDGKWHAPDETKPVPPVPPASPPRSKAGVLVVAALAVGGILALGRQATKDDTPGDRLATTTVTATRVVDRGSEAYSVCKRAVTERLKAPATAKFRSFRDAVVSGSGDGPYLVVSAVDSQNGFGALVRSGFVCKLTVVGSSWRLDDIAID